MMIRQDMGFTPAIDGAFRELDRLGVLIPASLDVGTYLSKHPGLSDIVVQATSAARRRLGHTVQLSLEVYRDPEADDCYPTLYVRSAENDKGIFSIIDEISSEYESAL